MQALNHEIATKLREIAQLLRAQQANPFRVNAYLHAADTLDNLLRNVAEILQAKGIKGLAALPSIGEGIARSIYEYVATGRMSRLENLRGAADPVELFRSIPARWKCLSLSLRCRFVAVARKCLSLSLHLSLQRYRGRPGAAVGLWRAGILCLSGMSERGKN
jgi:hypothetical protein